MRSIKTVIGVGAVLALAAVPGVSAAGAAGTDTNHDRLPDSWERAHHLSLSVNQARRDQDHDGVMNLSEFRHGTNPRRADTDRDGLNDRTELRRGSDPTDADTDDDGIRDGNDDSPGHDVGDDNGRHGSDD
jgi:Bacterial TSP3 repeat